MSDIDTTQNKEYNKSNKLPKYNQIVCERHIPFRIFFVDTFENGSYNEGIYYKLLVYIVCH